MVGGHATAGGLWRMRLNPKWSVRPRVGTFLVYLWNY